MSLLADLQADVLDPARSLTTALRRAKVLSFNLKNDELRSWVDNELSGYKDRALLPDYRTLKVRILGNFMNTFWKSPQQAIPLSVIPKDLRDGADEHLVRLSIPAVESVLQSKEDRYQIPLAHEFAAWVSYKVFDNLTCTRAWKEISRSQLVNIVESVRTRLLTIALELMDQVPDLTNDIWEKSREDTVSTIIHNNIYGHHNIVASGGQVRQNVSQTVERGNLETLVTALQGLGLRTQEVQEFREAVEEDGPRERQEGLGPRVSQLVGKLVGRTLDVASSATGTLVAQAIASYYGW